MQRHSASDPSFPNLAGATIAEMAEPETKAELPLWQRYGIALISILVAIPVRMALDQAVGRASRGGALLFVAIFVTAWYGGLGPALLAIAASGLVRTYIFTGTPPPGSPVVAFGFYLLTAITGTLMITKARAIHRQSEKNAALARAGMRRLQDEMAERQRTEVLLGRTRVDLATSQRIAHLGSWVSDLVTRELWWSEETYRIMGLPPETTLTRETFFQLVAADDRERVRAASERAQADGKPYWVEHRVVRPDGSERYVREQGEMVLDEKGKAIRLIGTVQDITEYHRLEQQFHQAQKMEAVGLLAGGVAHDFNNLLTVINGYGQVILQGMDASDPNRAMLEEIVSAGARATGLTRQLLTFGRRQIVEPKILQLNTVVNGIGKMLVRLIGEDVRLHVVLDSKAGYVKVDQGQLEQVIMNLAVNARDAMPHGGRLNIETANVDLDEAYAQTHVSAIPGPYVMLAATDTGTGMDEATLSRIFEPFFTTKRAGQGTGLGLATVYAILKQSHGHISVHSEPGRGSTFKIYLPRVVEDAQVADRPPTPGASVRRSETILVVEDDAGVRAVIQHVLPQHGYLVLMAGGSHEALQICRAHPGKIDLLVTDVVMPELAGPQLAEQIARMRPEIKILYMSGYAENSITQHGVLEPGIMLLPKPFTQEGLARKVQEVLDMPDGSSWISPVAAGF